MSEIRKDVLQPTTDDVVRQARTLVRMARHAAMATLDPAAGGPQATRVGLATDVDGTPLILVSALAAHTPALKADPRCALLVGEPGRGDALAHPRISLVCLARPVPKASADEARIAARYLAHNPKARLYAGLGDFGYFRLEVQQASFNGGFGKAYAMASRELLSLHPANAALAAAEASAVAHMNGEHSDAVSVIARHFAGAAPGNWVLLGLDAEGIDIASGDDVRRVLYPQPLGTAEELRAMLVQMSGEARRGLGLPVQ